MTQMVRSAAETDSVYSDAFEHLERTLGNSELPIAAHRQEFEEAITNNSVVILQGTTGSGKSTQTPQYALETGLFDEIIVTQPRIVAAREVCARVEGEIKDAGWDSSVGYYTSKERTEEPQYRQDIAFVTDGKAAAQLLHEKRRPGDTTKRILLIDEFHERNINIDQLVAIAREKTDPSSKLYDPNFTVVIMSATMDTSGLEKYFRHAAPPVIEVVVPTYKVDWKETGRAMANVALEYAEKPKGKVLAFLAGKREIKNLIRDIDSLQDHKPDPEKTTVESLHGQQTARQQRRAFMKYKKGLVIAATNAAETSITVADVTAVVDAGEERKGRIGYKEVATGSEELRLEDASQASLRQRAGRTGRTGPGEYVLCSPDGESLPVPYKDRPAYGTPDIQSVRLDSMLLRLKATGYEINDFQFFQAPPKEAVRAARQRLFTLGALDEEGVVTARGRRMEQLPLDPEYACMLVFAQEKGYSQVVQQHLVDIAAIMQLGGVLKRAPKEQRWRDLLETNETESDFIAQLDVYRELMQLPEQEWGDYDIIEYQASLVEQSRTSLAEKLRMELHEPSPINPNDRQAILTAINAGQLNQVWKKHGDQWKLQLGGNCTHEPAESSVAEELGGLATGTLFTLGLRKKDIIRVQNINAATPERLAQAAEHLTTEEVDRKTIRYDSERGQVVARVSVMLGSMILQEAVKPYAVEASAPQAIAARSAALKSIQDPNDFPKLTLETIGGALETIATKEYLDPVTGETLLAWKGAHSWCADVMVAQKSLEALRDKLSDEPRQAELSTLKKDIVKTERRLTALKQQGHTEVVKRLQKAKKQAKSLEAKQGWLEAAKLFIEQAKEAA